MFGEFHFGKDKFLVTYKDNNTIYFAFDMLSFMFCDKNGGINYTMERSGIDSCNFYIREREDKKDKRITRFVNIDGLIQWLIKKRNLNKKTFDDFLVKAKEVGILKKDFFMPLGCKEKEFSFLLQDYANYLGLKLERQIGCGDYLIDFVINDKLAIEFDENNYLRYDKEKELEREKYINQYYDLVRISDTDSAGLALAKITKGLKWY